MANDTIATLIKVENRRGAEAVHMKYLKHLYKSVENIESVKNLPEDKNFCTVTRHDNDLDICLNVLAGLLNTKSNIAGKMYQSADLIMVEVI